MLPLTQGLNFRLCSSSAGGTLLCFSLLEYDKMIKEFGMRYMKIPVEWCDDCIKELEDVER